MTRTDLNKILSLNLYLKKCFFFSIQWVWTLLHIMKKTKENVLARVEFLIVKGLIASSGKIRHDNHFQRIFTLIFSRGFFSLVTVLHFVLFVIVHCILWCFFHKHCIKFCFFGRFLLLSSSSANSEWKKVMRWYPTRHGLFIPFDMCICTHSHIMLNSHWEIIWTNKNHQVQIALIRMSLSWLGVFSLYFFRFFFHVYKDFLFYFSLFCLFVVVICFFSVRLLCKLIFRKISSCEFRFAQNFGCNRTKNKIQGNSKRAAKKKRNTNCRKKITRNLFFNL